MPEEYEIIEHPHLNHVRIFLVAIDYRTQHLHRDFEMDLVLAGEPVFICRNQACRLRPGNMMLINPDQLHEIRSEGGPATILSLQVSPRFFLGAVPDMETLFFDTMLPLAALSPDEAAQARRDLLELALVYMRKHPYYELDCVGRLSALMFRFLRELPLHHVAPEPGREARRRADRIRRIIDYVDENYTGKTRLQDIAGREGLSLNYLSAFVKENLNMTFQEYVGRLRLNQAKKLMLSEKKSLLDISNEAGFSDPRYLTKAFLAHVGMTPDAYRRRSKSSMEEAKIHRSPHSSERYFSVAETKRILLDVKGKNGEM